MKVSKRFLGIVGAVMMATTMCAGISASAAESAQGGSDGSHGGCSYELGDVNWDHKLDNTDVKLMNESLLGKRRFTTYQRLQADVNQDGRFNHSDVVALVKKINK